MVIAHAWVRRSCPILRRRAAAYLRDRADEPRFQLHIPEENCERHAERSRKRGNSCQRWICGTGLNKLQVVARDTREFRGCLLRQPPFQSQRSNSAAEP